MQFLDLPNYSILKSHLTNLYTLKNNVCVHLLYLLTCESHPASMFSRLLQTNSSFTSLPCEETMPALALSTQFRKALCASFSCSSVQTLLPLTKLRHSTSVLNKLILLYMTLEIFFLPGSHHTILLFPTFSWCCKSWLSATQKNLDWT